MITRHVKVVGRVQGIGYRRWAQQQAEKLGLSGWVRNSSDGSVELMIQGELNQVNQFLALCTEGPAFSLVLSVLPVVVPTSAPVPIEKGIFKIIASA